MKQYSKINLKYISIALLFFINIINSGAIRSNENPYSDDKKVHHSLYLEKDVKERMSVYPLAIPYPKDE